MNTQFNQQKPALVSVIAWTTLASGIVNLFWGFAAISVMWWTIVCIPFAILPSILGVFELIYAAKLFSNPLQVLKPSTNIAVFEIATILTFNVFSMAVGILALVFYNDPLVKDYFMRLNGTLSPEPVTPPMPVSLPDLEPAPVISSPMEIEEPVLPSIDEPSTPPTGETPAKPTRTPRKVAKK